MCRSPIASIDLCSEACGTQKCISDIQINYVDSTCISPSAALVKDKPFCFLNQSTPVRITFTGRWVGLEFNNVMSSNDCKISADYNGKIGVHQDTNICSMARVSSPNPFPKLLDMLIEINVSPYSATQTLPTISAASVTPSGCGTRAYSLSPTLSFMSIIATPAITGTTQLIANI